MEMIEVDVGRIKEGDYQMRLGYDELHVADLASSIRRIGLLEPLSVVVEGDDYLIVAGHHRFRACVAAGLEAIPVCVEEAGASDSQERAFASNFFRAAMTPVETASAIYDMYKTGTVGIAEIARNMNRSERWVAEKIDMMDWPVDVLELVHKGGLGVGAAGALAGIDDDVYREFLLKQAVNNGITARTAALWLQAYRSRVPAPDAAEIVAAPPPCGADTIYPSAPCFVCRSLERTDGLSRVFLCTRCAGQLSQAGAGGAG